jgi:hypothetical protein
MTPVRSDRPFAHRGSSCKGELIGRLGSDEFHRPARHRLANRCPVASISPGRGILAVGGCSLIRSSRAKLVWNLSRAIWSNVPSPSRWLRRMMATERRMPSMRSGAAPGLSILAFVACRVRACAARKSAVLVQVLLMQITLPREKLANRRTKDPVSSPVVAQSSLENKLYGWPLLPNGGLIRKQVLQRIAGQPAKSCLRISISPPPHHAS